MAPYVLQHNPSKNDTTWRFTVPQEELTARRPSQGRIYGKVIKFAEDGITIQTETFPSNRILHDDDPEEYLLASFRTLRFPESTLSETANYIATFLKAGLFLNEKQYRFYHHSNSQLRSRTCFLRRANSDKELDDRIYKLGDYGKIMNVAKRAKRIGLLFSEASQDLTLDPQWVADIPDLVSGDGEVFSDGCGLMSRRLAVQLAKNKNIVYRGTRYTPTVVQIRYKGYKGVLSLDPTMPEGIFAQFRKSMKKFTASVNNTFSVVGHSQPFTFGRLNNDVIVLLSALGITNEMFLQKQQQYFNWIIKATDTLEKSFNFLCALRLFDEAENVLLSEDQEKVQKGIRKAQLKELSAFTKEGTDKFRSRILMEKSRLLYGICDPYGVLKEGQVHVKVLTSKGRSTAIHTDVLVVRNPCLYPGDCLKLRAVQHPKLDHLIDCLVFAADAKAGHHSAPSMSSGGDLDGDQYFVCWDPDIVPKTVAQERLSTTITRENLANYFAQYNNASVARVSALHAKWVRASAKGALSPECQELNALHSQSVDGARIKIPDRLTLPPELREGYIIDLLAAAAKKFQEEFSETLKAEGLSALPSLDRESGFALLNEFLQNPRTALTEYELFNLVMRFSDRHHLTNDEIMAWLSHLDWSAIAFNEKHAILSTLKSKFNLVLSPERFPQIWNSLFESDLIGMRELQQRNLNHPFSMQRLYSSRISGLGPFWKYLRQTTQDFTRKLILFKTDERFVLAVFIRDDIPWNEEPEVADNVVVYSFLPETSDTFSTLRTMTKGYRLHCSFGIFELYNKIRRDTFIFISKPARGSPDEIIASVALQKISAPVQKQIGRVNRTPIVDVEMHVVSNRDRIAHQAFDQWFEHNPTEEFVGRFDYERTSYRRFELDDIDWKSEEYRSKEWMRLFLTQQDVRAETILRVLGQKTDDEIFEVLDLAYTCHQDEVFFASFSALITLRTSFGTTFVVEWIKKYPLLVFIVLHQIPPPPFPPEHLIRGLGPFILQSIVLCANEHSVASLAALQILQHEVVSLPLSSYSELLWVAANSLRARQVAQEVLLVLNDGRLSDDTVTQTPEMVYANRNLLGVVFDRAEEAFEECPCNEDGRPRHQKTAPAHLKSLRYLPEDKGGGTEKMIVAADMRVDSTFPARLHSHVRLQGASEAENAWIRSPILDGLVTGSLKGEIHISLVHPPPPDFQRMEWNLYHAGSTATSKAMLDAIITLLEQRRSACGIYPWIVGIDITSEDLHTGRDSQEFINAPTLNESQNIAVQTSLEAPLSLIWGPPGTGKTTVVVEILLRLLQQNPEGRILMTASTHNAVDNVLERFVKRNKIERILAEEQILRVATDVHKVNKEFHEYTIDARVGGDMNENNKLFKKAKERMDKAVIVFSTCAGAGLGILRKSNDFSVAIVDEASQITEPCALIPLVKGISRGVLVGDHVQLRPTVKKMGAVLQFDVSLLERLYTGPDFEGMSKTMLDVQYRFPKELAEFPSQSFYEGKLKTRADSSVVEPLLLSAFPWIAGSNGLPYPVALVNCDAEESEGGRSKSNQGQVDAVIEVLKLLSTRREGLPESSHQLNLPKATVLTPYTAQVRLLKQRLQGRADVFTVDSFQGRESDIIVFSSVRCNVLGDFGFLEDERRLNVMWTRAKLGLVLVGSKGMLERNQLWKKAVASARQVPVSVPVPLN